MESGNTKNQTTQLNIFFTTTDKGIFKLGCLSANVPSVQYNI